MNNTNGLIIEGFVRKITKEESNKIYERFKDNKELSYICEYGAIIFDESKYVLEDCENGDSYFATINMLVRGKDGVFVQLKHDVIEAIDIDKIPCFNGVFKIKEL